MNYCRYNFPIHCGKTSFPSGGLFVKLKRFFKVLYWSFTYNNTHRNLFYFVVSLVGLVSTLFRYGYIQQLEPNYHTHTLYYLIWVCVLFSSANCCWIYVYIFINIIKSFKQYRKAWESTLKKSNLLFPALLFGVLICVSLLAIWRLYSDMVNWGKEIVRYRLPGVWFYNVLLLFRLIQRLLSCSLIVTIAPVLHYWLKVSTPEFKELMVQLFPWHTFHLFQRFLTLATLIFMRPSGFENWAIFLLIQTFLLWIPAVSFTAANEYIFPILHVPKAYEKNLNNKQSSVATHSVEAVRMVTGLTHGGTLVEYPPNTELVRGGGLERFRNFLKPTVSHSTTQQGGRRENQTRNQRQTRTNQEYSFNDSDVLQTSEILKEKIKEDTIKEETIKEEVESTLTSEIMVVDNLEETQIQSSNVNETEKDKKEKLDSLFEKRTFINEEGILEFLPPIDTPTNVTKNRNNDKTDVTINRTSATDDTINKSDCTDDITIIRTDSSTNDTINKDDSADVTINRNDSPSDDTIYRTEEITATEEKLLIDSS